MFQYSETTFPLVEKQDEVYFRGGGAAGGLWRHQKIVAILAAILAAILVFTRN